MLGSRSTTTYLLINRLARRCDVIAVVFDTGVRRRLLRGRLRRLGFIKVVRQLAFLAWDAAVIRPRSRQKIAALLADEDLRPPEGRMPVTDLPNVNDGRIVSMLVESRPDVVVVSGTGIIGIRLLGIGIPFVNIHTGITPRYRGVHGGFWAVLEGRPDLAGTTIHMIDAGVDTGGILGQVPIEIDTGWDTFRTLPVKQYLAGLPLLEDVVLQAARGELVTNVRDDLESAQWYTPTLSDYIRFRMQLRSIARVHR